MMKIFIIKDLIHSPRKFFNKNSSNHICYKNLDYYFNKRYGLICKMINVVIVFLNGKVVD